MAAAAARTGKAMGKLTLQERGMARKLWEEVFHEDTEKFLDYYDSCVADHNQIFGEKESGALISMLQLNPYRIRMYGQEVDSYYIVAVATREVYRHQGRMKRLLTEALHEMNREKIPFTWLMPASEAIYQPFDFVTVYCQSLFSMGAALEKQQGSSWDCQPCKRTQIPELTAWSDQFLKEKTDVSTVRTESYYERIWKEQEAMNGQILLFYDKEELKGYCFTGCEGSAEAWEIAVREENQSSANRKAVEALSRYFAKKAQLPVRICGFLPESGIENRSVREMTFRPMTMVRIVNLEAFVKKLRAKERVTFEIKIKDPILEPNNGTFCFQIGAEDGVCRRSDSVDVPEMEIGELTEVLFGERRTDKIPQEKLHLLRRVYLNEVV